MTWEDGGKYCQAIGDDCPRKRNGDTPHAAATMWPITRSALTSPGTRLTSATPRMRWERSNLTHLAVTTFWETRSVVLDRYNNRRRPLARHEAESSSPAFRLGGAGRGKLGRLQL